MTSKISYTKIAKENLRHRLAYIMVVLFSFIMQILLFIMKVQNELSVTKQYKERYNNITAFAQPDVTMIIFTIALAAMLAITGFHYLHSKTQADFYQSLPIKRKTFFKIVAINSVLIFMIPLLVFTVIQYCIVGVLGYFSATFFSSSIVALLCYLVAFLITFFTATLAMVMTGHTFVGILGSLVFASYMPVVIRFLFPTYAQTFFSTYADGASIGGIFNYFSPVSLSLGLSSGLNGWSWSDNGRYMIAACVGILLIAGISYYLYMKRPAEMAGKAMAFPKGNAVIRVLIVIPMALYAGIYFYSMTLNSSRIWLIAGIIFGAFLFHGIVECIYQFDVHGLWSHKKQMGLSMAAALVIMAFFWSDCFGYDRYLPNTKDLKSVTIKMENMSSDSQIDYWGKENGGLTGEGMEQAMELLTSVVRDENDLSATGSGEESTEDGSGFYSTSVSLLPGASVSVEDVSEDSVIINVTYKMKNGKEKARIYNISTQAQEQLLNKLYATKDYKKGVYSLYTADRSDIAKVEYQDAFGYEQVSMTDQEQEAFYDIYLQELTSLTYEQIRNTCPIGKFTVTHKTPNTYGRLDENYYIYPAFTQSIEYLAAHGLELKSLGSYNLIRFDITQYSDSSDSENRYTITDPSLINSVKQNLVPQMFAEDTGYDAYDPGTEIDISVKGDNGEIKTITALTDTDTAEKLE